MPPQASIRSISSWPLPFTLEHEASYDAFNLVSHKSKYSREYMDIGENVSQQSVWLKDTNMNMISINHLDA